MTHGLLLKYILSHGIGIDVFSPFLVDFRIKVLKRQKSILFGKRAKCNRRTCRF